MLVFQVLEVQFLRKLPIKSQTKKLGTRLSHRKYFLRDPAPQNLKFYHLDSFFIFQTLRKIQVLRDL